MTGRTDEEREMLADTARAIRDAADDMAYGQTAAGIRQALHRATNLPTNEQDAARIAHLETALVAAETREHAEYVAGLSAEDAAFAATWTRAATISRRQAWNDAVRALPKGHGPAKIIRSLGFRPEDLKRAVALHGL